MFDVYNKYMFAEFLPKFMQVEYMLRILGKKFGSSGSGCFSTKTVH